MKQAYQKVYLQNDGTVELIMEFEREFDIQIPDDQAEKIATVGQAVQYIESSKQSLWNLSVLLLPDQGH